jgi:hypothetical protein
MATILPALSSSDALQLAVRASCVARAISLIELAATPEEMRAGGMFNWEVLGLMSISGSSLTARLGRLFLRIPHRIFVFTLFLEAIFIFALFIRPTSALLILAAATAFLLQMKRHYLSFDGADQMTFVTLVAAFLGSIGNASRPAVIFLAAEVSVAYLVAGSYKVSSPF